MTRSLLVILAFAVCRAQPPAAPSYPQETEGDWVAHDFVFHTGEKLADLRLHYITLGAPHRDTAGHVDNAAIVLHGTGGTGRPFLSATFGGELFREGQPLDATTHYIILPDDVGHGHSSKPSDGLRMKFPHYDYSDMVRAEHALVHDGLHVDHLRLVMGTSMGAMHTWLWGEMYPDYMDALMPLASAPVPIVGRNRMFRDMIIQAIKGDPAWKNGDYTEPPAQGLMAAEYSLWMMTSSPLQLQKTNNTREKADEAVTALRQRALRSDADDMLYYFDASSDYNPDPDLEKIKAPLYAINSADDEVNPPELGILEREIKRVRHGRYILIPISAETRGHGTHSRPAVWKQYLIELLNESQPLGHGDGPVGTPDKKSERHAALRNPRSGYWAEAAPGAFQVKIATTRGDFTIEGHREWAPRGADRFYNLARAGFFDDSRFYRVLAGYIVQFGIAGDPAVAQAWREERFPDDPPRQSNVRGTVAFAMTGPDTRTTQIYINLKDNPQLDGQGFAPFGRVSEGWSVVESLYAEYGAASGGGMRAGKQGPLFEGGNGYLDREFPKLDRLLSASVM